MGGRESRQRVKLTALSSRLCPADLEASASATTVDGGGSNHGGCCNGSAVSGLSGSRSQARESLVSLKFDAV